MGRRYSIISYIQQENIYDCLNWLKNNTISDEIPLEVKINNEILKINGEYCKLNNQYITKEKIIDSFESLTFSSSIILDIEPIIINSIANWNVSFDIDSLEEFKDDFDEIYLGKGKIRISGFETTISKLGNSIYEIEILALTGDNSDLIEKSLSFKKWIIEFSNMSSSIITYLDFEEARRIIFHRGKLVNITLKDNFEKLPLELAKKIMEDYYNLEFNT